MRRLPVYLVIDTSESMAGEAIEEVRSGMASLCASLRSDAHALETVFLSLITYDSDARQIVPLTEVAAFSVPNFVLGAGTAFGAALDKLDSCLKTEVEQTSADKKGDFIPIVFIVTDGVPTDNWETAARVLKERRDKNRLAVVAIACGADAAVASLKTITDQVIVAIDADAASLKNVFKWLTMSISTASVGIDQAGGSLDFDKLPEFLRKANDSHCANPDSSFVFLHARCTGNSRFYLIRYRKYGELETSPGRMAPVFLGVAAHPLDEFHFDLSERGRELRIPAEQLFNAPPCPYCESSAWAMCACGGIHCCQPTDNEGSINMTCPWCGKTGTYEGSGSFDVGRSAG